jgi:hypothetical protein
LCVNGSREKVVTDGEARTILKLVDDTLIYGNEVTELRQNLSRIRGVNEAVNVFLHSTAFFLSNVKGSILWDSSKKPAINLLRGMINTFDVSAITWCLKYTKHPWIEEDIISAAAMSKVQGFRNFIFHHTQVLIIFAINSWYAFVDAFNETVGHV